MVRHSFQYPVDCKKQTPKVNIKTHTVDMLVVKYTFTQGALSSLGPEFLWFPRAGHSLGIPRDS